MLLNIHRLLPLALAAAFGSCEADHSRPPASVRPAPAVARHPAPLPPAVAPAPSDSGLTDLLGPIRANFRRINAIRRWSSTVGRGLDESGEGGEAIFYYANRRLEKVAARHYGEMSQLRVEYYLLGGQPSFVLEKLYRYNRPIYFDSAAMRAAHDTQAFRLVPK